MIQRKQFSEEMQAQLRDAYDLGSARELKKYDAVIVGAGLAGLTAAVEASRAGKTVLVIESRQERYAAIRPQIIYLHSMTLDYLIKLNENKANLDSADAKLLNRLDEIGHFSIKDIQRYLLRCIDRRYCAIRYESVVAGINLDEGSLVAANVNDPLQQVEIKFDNLILADGAKHPTARLLESHIEYKSVADRPEKKHIMGYFTVTSKDGASIENPIKGLLAPVMHNNRCGLIYHEREVKEVGKQNKLKVFIVMHVSNEQYRKYKSNKELGIKFLRHCVDAVFEGVECEITISKSVKCEVEKDKLKSVVFKLNFIEAKKTAFEHHGHNVILVGDARRGPDFYQGHGGNDAISDGRDAAMIVRKKSEIGDYQSERLSRSKQVADRTIETRLTIFHFTAGGRNPAFIVPAFDDNVSEKELSLSGEQFRIFTSAAKVDVSTGEAEDLIVKFNKMRQ